MGGLSRYYVKFTFLVLLTIISLIILSQQSHYETYPNHVHCSSLYMKLHNSAAAKFGKRYANDAFPTSNLTGRLPTTNLSAFNVLGYGNASLMIRMDTPREELAFSLSPKNISCKDGAFKKRALWSMIVCVKSNIKNGKRRNIIRLTWGAQKILHGVRLVVLFIVGKDEKINQTEITEEQKRYGDLLQINIKEQYTNVGWKVLAGMQWIKTNCQSHWFYSSADDDMMPDLQKVYGEIHNEMTADNSENMPIICQNSLRNNEGPIRDQRYRNYVPYEHYSKDSYPSFCTGGFYSMPASMSNALYQMSRYHKYFYNDDVWLTALLRLSAVDAGLVWCRDVTNQFCGLAKFKGGSVQHAFGDEKVMLDKLSKMYASRYKPGAVNL